MFTLVGLGAKWNGIFNIASVVLCLLESREHDVIPFQSLYANISGSPYQYLKMAYLHGRSALRLGCSYWLGLEIEEPRGALHF